jgi:folylpolyglutamate synthase/dihydropteroate synthase
MKPTNSIKQSIQESKNFRITQYHYNELIKYFDTHWLAAHSPVDISHIKGLDKAFGAPSKELTSIVIAGTNGKSITAHFTTRLLQEEGLSVGTFLSPHILTYNERFSIKGELISNKAFTELGNEVIAMAQSEGIETDTLTLLTMMAFLHFHRAKVDVVIMEQTKKDTEDPVSILKPSIFAITRVSDHELLTNQDEINRNIEILFQNIPAGTHIISADQNKSNLNKMENLATQYNAVWHMAIRKLVDLMYPFGQMHGRNAALAERIASTFINHQIENKFLNVVTGSLLAKQKGRRGRPTTTAKRKSEEEPKRKIEHFWKNTVNLLPNRFQLLEKEKPLILLDTASNLDALKNILLGVRLLHYQKPLKGFALILGFSDNIVDVTELLKTLRYFFKKTSGHVIVCPINPLPGHNGNQRLDAEKLTSEIKGMKVKAKYASSFSNAIEIATQNVDERFGLIMITGSPSIVAEYWKYKDLKK